MASLFPGALQHFEGTEHEANINQDEREIFFITGDEPALRYKDMADQYHYFYENVGDTDILAHIADTSIHYPEESINHLNISGVGINTHDIIDAHLASGEIHFDDLTSFGIPTTSGAVDSIDFNFNDTASYTPGRVYYSDGEKTLAVHADNPDFPKRMGKLQDLFATNNTGVTITKGTCVDVHGLNDSFDGLNMHAADAQKINNNNNEGWVVGVLTEDCIDGAEATVGRYGNLFNIDTTGLIAGQPAYLGVDGNLSATRPNPGKSILMGTAIYIHATNGIFAIAVQADDYDSKSDGTINELQGYELVADGGKVYIDVYNEEFPTHTLPAQLGGQILQLDTLTGAGVGGRARLELLLGTATSALAQKVYIDNTGGVATLKTTAGYPPMPFCTIGEISLNDYATFVANGVASNRRVSSFEVYDSKGTLAVILERLGAEFPVWRGEGCTPTAITDETVMNVSNTAGFVLQTRRQSFPALDISVDGCYVANGPGGNGLDNYTKVYNLADLAGYTALDEARDNSCTGNLFGFGAVNKTTGECRIYINLPNQLKSSNDSSGRDIYYDRENTTVSSAQLALQKTAFAMFRIPYRWDHGAMQFLDADGAPTNDGAGIFNLLGTPMGIVGGAAGTGSAPVPPLIDVLVEGANAGGISITNGAAGVGDNDYVIKSQIAGIATNASDIATNASDIITNTSGIETNASGIITNASDIGVIEAEQIVQNTAIDGKVSKAGDTMTGALAISGSAAIPLTLDSTSTYTQIDFKKDALTKGNVYWEHSTSSMNLASAGATTNVTLTPNGVKALTASATGDIEIPNGDLDMNSNNIVDVNNIRYGTGSDGEYAFGKFGTYGAIWNGVNWIRTQATVQPYRLRMNNNGGIDFSNAPIGATGSAISWVIQSSFLANGNLDMNSNDIVDAGNIGVTNISVDSGTLRVFRSGVADLNITSEFVLSRSTSRIIAETNIDLSLGANGVDMLKLYTTGLIKALGNLDMSGNNIVDAGNITTNNYVNIKGGVTANPTGGTILNLGFYDDGGTKTGTIKSRDWDGAQWEDLKIECADLNLAPTGSVNVGGNLDMNTNDIVDVGTLTAAQLTATNLPTSASGLSAGDIWNDSGTLKIV